MAYENCGSVKNLLTKTEPWKYNFELEAKGITDAQNEALEKGYKDKGEIERYFIYRSTASENKGSCYDECNKLVEDNLEKYGNIPDCDGSGENCELAADLYKILWGWKTKGTDQTFFPLTNKTFKKSRFGGDTMNSPQTIINYLMIEIDEKNQKYHFERDAAYEKRKREKPECKYPNISIKYCLHLYKMFNSEFIEKLNSNTILKNYIAAYHTLGNFVLVPEQFNGVRGINYTEDFWDSSLVWLKKYGFIYLYTDKNTKAVCEINKKNRIMTVSTKNSISIDDWVSNNPKTTVYYFNKEYFVQYINYFFLWDYVKMEGEKYKVKKLFNSHDKIEDGDNFSDSAAFWTNVTSKEEAEEFMKNATAFIRRRGIFMTAMLKLSPQDYKTLQGEIFSKDEVYKSFEYVIEMVIQKVKKFQSPYDDIIEILKKSSDLEKIKEELQAENVR